MDDLLLFLAMIGLVFLAGVLFGEEEGKKKARKELEEEIERLQYVAGLDSARFNAVSKRHQLTQLESFVRNNDL